MQQAWSSSPDQEEPPEPLYIKEELNDLWTSQDQELRELEESDVMKFTLSRVSDKSEEHGAEKQQSSRCHGTGGVGEECGGPEPTRNSNPDKDLRPNIDGKTSHTVETETDDSDDWRETRKPVLGLNCVKNIGGCSSGDKSFSCSECVNQFDRNANVKSQTRLHPGKKPFHCSVCSKRFAEESGETHDPTAQVEEPQCCNVCGKTFSQLNHLKKHQTAGCQPSRLHQSQTRQTKTEARGEDCGGPGPTTVSDPGHPPQPRDLVEADTDERETNESQSGLKDVDVNTLKTSVSPSEGSSSFGHEEHLRRHSENQTVKPFICSVCGRGYKWKYNLMTHMRLHSEGKRFRCPVCIKSFQFRSEIVKHMRVHMREKPFSCSICGTTFKVKEALKSHMKIHTEETTFSCSVCGRTYNWKCNLITHMRLHSEGKRFSCSVCKKSFQFQSEVVRHMRIHTGEKPYRCSLCGASFRIKDYLNIHMRIHTGEKPFSCPVCQKEFRVQQQMAKHMKIHRQTETTEMQ